MNVTYAPSIERMIGLWERDCAASAAMLLGMEVSCLAPLSPSTPEAATRLKRSKDVTSPASGAGSFPQFDATWRGCHLFQC